MIAAPGLLVFGELERVEQRVLGALRCVDLATGADILTPLTVTAPGARILRNRLGLYVIAAWDELAGHAAAFAAPPDAPPLFDKHLLLDVTDPSGRYLPRRVDVALPRDPAPDHADQADSLFRPVVVPMYPGPAAPTLANWAVLRVTVRSGDDALGGALVRVVGAAGTLARGLTDWRGEALVPVVGIPVTTWSDDPNAVIVSAIDVTIDARFDPASGTRTPLAAVADGTPPPILPLVDPARLEADAAGLPGGTAPRSLAAGRGYSLALEVALP